MERSLNILTVLVFVMSPKISVADETTGVQIGKSEIIGREYSIEEYFDQARQTRAHSGFPPLSFPGVDGLKWGEELSAAPNLATYSNLWGESIELLTEPGKSVEQQLIGVKVALSTDGADRESKLEIFSNAKARLIENYGQPTHSCKPEQTYLGEDSFEKGLVSQYRVEWHGSNAIVSLCVSETAVVVERRKPSDDDTTRCFEMLCK